MRVKEWFVKNIRTIAMFLGILLAIAIGLTVTGYFIIDKKTLELLKPGQYPEAEHGEISVEYPINHPEVPYATCMISPTKDGSDYDWSDYLFCNEIVTKLIDEIEKHIHAVKGEKK